MSFVDFEKRPFLNIRDLCVPLERVPKELCFHMPGGLTICVPRQINWNTIEYAQYAVGVANTALAPLKPFMDLFDLVMSIAELLTIVPEIATNPEKLKRFKELLLKMAEKVKVLARLIPPLSFYVIFLDLFDAILMLLEGLATEFDALVVLSRRIQDAQLSVNRSPGLESIISCSEQNLETQLDNLKQIFASLNAIIEIINFVGKMAKAPGFPIASFGSSSIGTFADVPAESIIFAGYIRDLVAALGQIRSKVDWA